MSFKYLGHDARYAALRAASIFTVRGYDSVSPDLRASLESTISATGFVPSVLDPLHPATIADGTERRVFNRLRCVSHFMSRTRLALSRRQAYQLCRLIASSSRALCMMSKARGLYRWRDSAGRVVTPVFLAPSDRVPVKRWDNNSSDYYPGVAVCQDYRLEPWHLEFITKSLRDFYVAYCGRYPSHDVDVIMRELEGYGHWVMLCTWVSLGAHGRIVDHPYRDIFRAISDLWYAKSGPGAEVSK
jgi:hypothetical protein